MPAQKAPASPANPGMCLLAGRQRHLRARLLPSRLIHRRFIRCLSLSTSPRRIIPTTRVAWENAVARAADLGIAKSTLYPTLAAAALAESARDNVFFAPSYYRQTTGTFTTVLTLDYTIFDFGRRLDEVAINRSNLLAANFLFNDTHRTIIFQVMQAYYRLLDTKGQEDAAEANLKNAQTVQEAAEARLKEGLATLPDVARSPQRCRAGRLRSAGSDRRG